MGSNKSQPVKLTDLCDMVLALTLPEKKVEISSLDAPSQDDQQKIIDALIKANEQGANSINERNITFNGKDIYVAKQTEDLAGNKGWARKTLTISDVAVLKSVEPLTLTTTELVDAQKVEVADPAKPEDFTDTQLSAIKDALNKVNAKVGDKDAVSDVYYEQYRSMPLNSLRKRKLLLLLINSICLRKKSLSIIMR